MPITVGYPPPPTGINNNASQARGWGTGWPNCQSNKQVKITLSNKVTIWVRTEISDLVTLLLNEVLRRGYPIRDLDTGGYNCRAITGTTIPSNHSWGLAVDINWNSNPMGSHTTNIPRWMVELMWLYRFYWGGWFATPDPMHFEYIGTPTQAASDTARARQALEAPMALNAAQDAALSQAWASEVAQRDGVTAPVAKGHPGGKHWQVEQLKEIETQLTSLLTQVGALTVTVANINERLDNVNECLEELTNGEVTLNPVTVTGQLTFTQTQT